MVQVWKRRQEENGYLIMTIVIATGVEHFICIISLNSHSHLYENHNHSYLNLPYEIVTIVIFIYLFKSKPKLRDFTLNI